MASELTGEANCVVANVILDVPTLHKSYSYLVDSNIKNFNLLQVGTLVRVPLNSRFVLGWVLSVDPKNNIDEPDDNSLKPQLKNIKSVVSLGPKVNVVNLCLATSKKYFSGPGYFLKLASFKRNILNKDYFLADKAETLDVNDQVIEPMGSTQNEIVGYIKTLISQKSKSEDINMFSVTDLSNRDQKNGYLKDFVGRKEFEESEDRPFSLVVKVPPNHDLLWLIKYLVTLNGTLLILTPSSASMSYLYKKVKDLKLDIAYESDLEVPFKFHKILIGNRNSIFTSKTSEISAVLITDFENKLYSDERAPYWNAVEVANIRSGLEKIPLILSSSNPDVSSLYALSKDKMSEFETLTPKHKIFSYPKNIEINSWAFIEVAKKYEDQRSGLLSKYITERIRSVITKNLRKVLVIYQQKGYINSLVCAECGLSAKCQKCFTLLKSKKIESYSRLYCTFCDTETPRMCFGCGSFNLRIKKKGFMAVTQELESVLGKGFKITTDPEEFISSKFDILVNTSLALNKLSYGDFKELDISLIVFLDFDQFLFAPEIDSANVALSFLAQSSNIVGAKNKKPSGSIIVQTSDINHYLFSFVKTFDFDSFVNSELEKRKLLYYPPFCTIAVLSGSDLKALSRLISEIDSGEVQKLGPTQHGQWMLKSKYDILAKYLDRENINSKIKVKLTL